MKYFFIIFSLLVALPVYAQSVSGNLPITVTHPSSSGTACPGQVDSGRGVSLGLSCNTALSDDFNGMSIDSNKWGFNFASIPPTEGNDFVTFHLQGPNNFAGAIFTLAHDTTARPLYYETRLRVNNPADGTAIYQWWMTGGTNIGCSGNGTNMPEIDVNETYQAPLNPGGALWNGCSPTFCIFCGAVGPSITDGNFHVFGMTLDANPAPNGTITFYEDGASLVTYPQTNPYMVHPEQGSLGQGYQFIFSAVCKSCASNYSGTMDVDYIHVYQ